MKRSLLTLAGITALAAAVSVSSTPAAAPASPAACGFLPLPPATASHVQALWGHIRSLDRKNGRFEMRFDPAWWLGGVTASRAALEDTGSPDVPNDYYVVDESHRLLTYVVSPSARVTVLTNGNRGICATEVRVSELAQVVKGKNPKRRALLDPGNHLGFWIRIGFKYPNPVRSLDQQYQP
jgi:hypothetical protein